MASQLLLQEKANSPETQSETGLQLALLGRKVFFDQKFSKEAKSCASCHLSDKAFSGGMGSADLGARDAPSLINSGIRLWLNWDGSRDSLTAQALKSFEDPKKLGMSRVAITHIISTYYKADYEALFGRLSIPKQRALPEHGLPRPQIPALPLNILASALSTLGDFQTMKRILEAAEVKSLAPATVIGEMALRLPVLSSEWHSQWNDLKEKQKEYVNLIFVNTGKAVAAFLSTVNSLSTPFDAFAKTLINQTSSVGPPELGEGFGPEEYAGFKLFVGRAGCVRCHSGQWFTDQKFHNIGLGFKGRIDLGRVVAAQLVKSDPFNCNASYFKADLEILSRESCLLQHELVSTIEQIGAFKTPSLRGLSQTAPFMHDGRFATLDQVLDFYNELHDRPAIGVRDEWLRPLHLKKKELTNLKAFLRSLNSGYSGLSVTGRVGPLDKTAPGTF
jgi:cytochrome c peroxidase